MGLLDLPSPLFDLIDAGVALILPWSAPRIALYGALLGAFSMWIYRRTSRQQELAGLTAEASTLRAELATWDGPFAGLRERIARLLRINARHLRLALGPALIGALPLLPLLPWLSNQHGHVLPAPGSAVNVTVEPAEAAVALHWSDPTRAERAGPGSWTVRWPEKSETLDLRQDGRVLAALPPSAAIPVIHVRMPIWNALVDNPAGYLPSDSVVRVLRFELAPRRFWPFGPAWSSGWEVLLFLPMLLIALWLRQRWALK